jgi:hypothetical protein
MLTQDDIATIAESARQWQNEARANGIPVMLAPELGEKLSAAWEDRAGWFGRTSDLPTPDEVVAVAGATSWGPGEEDPPPSVIDRIVVSRWLVREVRGNEKKQNEKAKSRGSQAKRKEPTPQFWEDKADGVMVFGVFPRIPMPELGIWGQRWPLAENALSERIWQAMDRAVWWIVKRLVKNRAERGGAWRDEQAYVSYLRKWLLDGCECWKQFARMRQDETSARNRCNERHRLSLWNPCRESLFAFLQREVGGGTMANAFHYGMYAKVALFDEVNIGKVPFCRRAGCGQVLPIANYCDGGDSHRSEVTKLTPWVLDRDVTQVELWRCGTCGRYWYITDPTQEDCPGSDPPHKDWPRRPTRADIPVTVVSLPDWQLVPDGNGDIEEEDGVEPEAGND